MQTCQVVQRQFGRGVLSYTKWIVVLADGSTLNKTWLLGGGPMAFWDPANARTYAAGLGYTVIN